MEDAVDALKMAFSVFLFVIALTIVFQMFAMAREVSDYVLGRTDRTYFASYEYPTRNSDSTSGGRVVGIESIIPTLYRYFDEDFSVAIRDTSGTITEKFNIELERALYREDEEYFNQYFTEELLAKLDSATEARLREDIGSYSGNKELYGGNTKYVIWTGSSGAGSVNGNQNEDVQIRVSGYIAKKRYKINYSELHTSVTEGLDKNGLYEESFVELYEGKRDVGNDGSIIDFIKGKTKMFISYKLVG